MKERGGEELISDVIIKALMNDVLWEGDSVCVCVFVCVLVTQSCLTLCDSMDCTLSGSSAHGILQARTLEWVAITLPRGGDYIQKELIQYCKVKKKGL